MRDAVEPTLPCLSKPISDKSVGGSLQPITGYHSSEGGKKTASIPTRLWEWRKEEPKPPVVQRPPDAFQRPMSSSLVTRKFSRSIRRSRRDALVWLPLLWFALQGTVAAQIRAFPGAEGYGAFAAGGRGGDVYHVTNLNPSGPGSFIEGISTVPSAGRTIVFDVSGYIRLPSGSKGTRLTASKVTIAGQTAPGDGVGFTNNFLRLSGDDLVMRHLRFRRGKTDASGDCIDLDSGCNNVVLDHLSIMWSTDENISSFDNPPDNLTFQHSLNAWGLESHSCGGLWDQARCTTHHTLWAHNHTRNPKARPGMLEWVNNVTFDWDIGFIMGDSDSPADWKANVIGNYFLCPPGNIRKTPLEKAHLSRDGKPNFSVHVSNNLHDMDGDRKLSGIDRGWDIVGGTPFIEGKDPKGNYTRLDKPVSGSGALAIDNPLTAYKKVVSQAGALRLDANFSEGVRDEVDARLIEDVTELRRNHITRESDLKDVSNKGFGKSSAAKSLPDGDADGMPDMWEAALPWNPKSKDNNEEIRGASFFPEGTSSGYTALEEYLHFKSVPHLFIAKGAITRPEIDLSRYTAGFANSPKFTLSKVTGGTAIQGGPGGKLVRFTAGNIGGRGGFLFTVTDADGSKWTQQFAICVTGS